MNGRRTRPAPANVISSDRAPSFCTSRKAVQRSLFGYRRGDVDEALAANDALLAEQEGILDRRAAELEERAARIVQLEITCDSLSERVVRREQELADVRADLERLRAEGERGTRSLLLLAEEIEAVRKQARGQATRIRMRALRDAVELGERIGELARDPGGAGERLFESLQGAIASIAAGEGSGSRSSSSRWRRTGARTGRPPSCSTGRSRSRLARSTTSRSSSGSRTRPAGSLRPRRFR